MIVYIISFIFISMYLLNRIYLPDVNWHVYNEVEQQFTDKGRIMALTTANRIEGFERLQKDNAVKLANFIDPLFNVTDNNYSKVFPINWNRRTSDYQFCTHNVSDVNK